MPIDLGIPYFCFKFCHLHPPLEAILLHTMPADKRIKDSPKMDPNLHNEAI